MGQKILGIINADLTPNKAKMVPIKEAKSAGKAKKKPGTTTNAVIKSANKAPWNADRRPQTNMRFSLIGSANGPLPKDKNVKKIPSTALS